MAERSEGAVTAYLAAMSRGDQNARSQLWDAVYDELRGIAARMMRGESASHTLQPTALVNEAYMRLVGGERLGPKNRAYFFSAAAQAMRRILIEHARRMPQPKGRGGATADAPFDLSGLTVGTYDASSEDLRKVDKALEALAEHDQRVSEVVMLRFFCGLTVEQTAETLDISPRTVKRCWTFGRSWLFRRLTEDAR